MRFILAFLLLVYAILPAYATHKPNHNCIAIDKFETDFKQNNPDLHLHITMYNKLMAMKFIAFSYMELGIQPPDENPELITGLYFMYADEHENGFIAIMNGNTICSNAMINKKTFDLIIQSLSQDI